MSPGLDFPFPPSPPPPPPPLLFLLYLYFLPWSGLPHPLLYFYFLVTFFHWSPLFSPSSPPPYLLLNFVLHKLLWVFPCFFPIPNLSLCARAVSQQGRIIVYQWRSSSPPSINVFRSILPINPARCHVSYIVQPVCLLTSVTPRCYPANG